MGGGTKTRVRQSSHPKKRVTQKNNPATGGYQLPLPLPLPVRHSALSVCSCRGRGEEETRSKRMRRICRHPGRSFTTTKEPAHTHRDAQPRATALGGVRKRKVLRSPQENKHRHSNTFYIRKQNAKKCCAAFRAPLPVRTTLLASIDRSTLEEHSLEKEKEHIRRRRTHLTTHPLSERLHTALLSYLSKAPLHLGDRSVLGGHVAQQVHHPVRVGPLVVVPRHDLEEPLLAG